MYIPGVCLIETRSEFSGRLIITYIRAGQRLGLHSAQARVMAVDRR